MQRINSVSLHNVRFFVQSGRALLFPVYKGTYERRPTTPISGLARDGDQPLALRRAVCAGFHQHDQTEFLRPYVDRFVDELGALWRSQVRQESIDMTEGLFPRAVVDEETLRAGERGLETPDLPEAGRRVLLEELDELRRTLRARASDIG
jgi:hypothetical protein